MKLAKLLATGLVVATLGLGTAASAQGRHDDRRSDQRDRRDDHRYDRHDNGRHNGWNKHRRCHTEWRHHRRVQICR